MLVCPLTLQPLAQHSLAEAELRVGAKLLPARRWPGRSAHGEAPKPIGATPQVWLREDARAAYPILNGIPVLIAPERLEAVGGTWTGSLSEPQYAEAYDEMEHYNRAAERESENLEDSRAWEIVLPAFQAGADTRARFPLPREVWVEGVYDCAAEFDAMQHIAPVAGKRILQLGGRGTFAVMFLLAGAAEAWNISPMPGEALCAMRLAERAGVAARLHCVVGVAEELPFCDASFDCAFSVGCVHHMATAMAFPQIARVLKQGSPFAAVEPWRAPFYGFGTGLLGQREKGAYCRPLTAEKTAPLARAFSQSEIIHHGALTRYFMLALQKLGLRVGLNAMWRINAVDDRLSSLLGIRAAGSSVALLARKS